jgi:drug/metabolite transporter (DMT)-like permease
MSSLWMIAASFCFALMGSFIKISSAKLAMADIVFYRTMINFLIVAVLMRARGTGVKTAFLGLHVRRSMIGNLALALGFYSITHLPLGTAVTLNYTTPIFLAILSVVFLRQRPSAGLCLAVLIGFVGILVLLQPTLGPEQYVAALVGLACGLVTALAYYNVGLLVRAGEPETRVVFYFSLIGTLSSLAWLTVQGFSALDGTTILLVLGFSLCGTLGQLAMTRAYGRGSALITGAFSYSTIVFSSLFGLLFFDERLEWLGWTGIALVIFSGALAMASRLRTASAAPAMARP